MTHVNVDPARIAIRAVAPYRAQELQPVEQNAGTLDQRAQELELGKGQLDGAVVDSHLAPASVETHPPPREDILRVAVPTRPSHYLPDAGALLRQPACLRYMNGGSPLAAPPPRCL